MNGLFWLRLETNAKELCVCVCVRLQTESQRLAEEEEKLEQQMEDGRAVSDTHTMSYYTCEDLLGTNN